MFRKSLPDGGGLIIEPCNGVVCFFMRFPIDVVFVDREGAVCHLIRNMRPWRVSRIVPRSRLVIELPTGTIDATETAQGDVLDIEQT